MAAKIRMPRARAAPASKYALFALAVSGAGTMGPTPSEESELLSDNMRRAPEFGFQTTRRKNGRPWKMK